MAKIAALVPLKLQSRRLPNKNFLRLGDQPLSAHILETLVNVPSIDDVFVYASQPQIMELLPDGTRFLARPTYLDGDSVKANELFLYAVERLDAEIIVLCHATSPYMRRETIADAIDKVATGEFDCALAVQKHQTYCWYEGKPLNYDPMAMAQTQNLAPVYAETSGVYVFRKEDYLRTHTRINGRPYLVEVDDREAVDIDHPEDFALALSLLDHDPTVDAFQKDLFFVDLARAKAQQGDLELVTFDLDGVLINSLPAMEQAWQGTMQRVGLSIPFSEYAKLIGYPFASIIERLGVPEPVRAEVTHIYNELAIAAHDAIRLYPGVVDGLKTLAGAGFKLAIATSKNRERTRLILERLFGDIAFDCVMTPEDVLSERGKPSPDQLLQAALKVGVDPASAVYVGDMEVDQMAAKRAGFGFVHAGWGYGSISSTKHTWFATMTDLCLFLSQRSS